MLRVRRDICDRHFLPQRRFPAGIAPAHPGGIVGYWQMADTVSFYSSGSRGASMSGHVCRQYFAPIITSRPWSGDAGGFSLLNPYLMAAGQSIRKARALPAEFRMTPDPGSRIHAAATPEESCDEWSKPLK
jgi:hypothetical protein